MGRGSVTVPEPGGAMVVPRGSQCPRYQLYRKVGLLTYQNGCFMGFNGWLVVWNMNFIFPYFGNNNPN